MELSLVIFLLLTRVCVNKPTSREELMNRSFWLAVLMVLENRVCQPPVPDVFGNKMRSAVLAVTFEEGRLSAWAVPSVTGNARLKAMMLVIRPRDFRGMWFSSMVFSFLPESALF